MIEDQKVPNSKNTYNDNNVVASNDSKTLDAVVPEMEDTSKHMDLANIQPAKIRKRRPHVREI